MSESGDDHVAEFDDADVPDPADFDAEDELDVPETDEPSDEDDDDSDEESEEDSEDDSEPENTPVRQRSKIPPGIAPRIYGTRTGVTPRSRECYVIPLEQCRTSRALSTYEYAGVLAARTDMLGRKGDDRGCLTDEQIATLPGGSRLQVVAVAEINYGRCPLSVERHVGFAEGGKKILEIIPVNSLTLPFEPAWPPISRRDGGVT